LITSLILAVEFLIEDFEVLKSSLHFLGWADQVSYSEMVCVLFLAEPRPRNCHDTCLLDHIHAVQKVGSNSTFLSFSYSALREVDLRESIHGSLDLGACDFLHLVESL
jgi:hypothetical protein